MTIGEEKIISEVERSNKAISIGLSVAIATLISDLIIIPAIAQYSKNYENTYINICNRPVPEIKGTVASRHSCVNAIPSFDVVTPIIKNFSPSNSFII